jgi:predicted SPOUT superfamily RNA methylase MTH1
MVNRLAGSTIQFSFKGKDIYWRAVKGPDCGKVDVFLDNVLQKTVDCWASIPPWLFKKVFIQISFRLKLTSSSPPLDPRHVQKYIRCLVNKLRL